MSGWKRFLPVATTIVVSFVSLAVAQDPHYFSPKGKQPSKYAIDLKEHERQTLPFSDKRDFDVAYKLALGAEN